MVWEFCASFVKMQLLIVCNEYAAMMKYILGILCIFCENAVVASAAEFCEMECQNIAAEIP